METVGRNPGRILAIWRDFVGKLRAVVRSAASGNRSGPGRTAGELVECQLHEELLNHAFDAHTPLRLRCPYDAVALSAEKVIDSALASHPLVWERGAASAPSPCSWRATPPGDLLRRPLSEPAGDSMSWVVRNVLLAELRSAVAARATDAGLDEGRAAEVVLVTMSLRPMVSTTAGATPFEWRCGPPAGTWWSRSWTVVDTSPTTRWPKPSDLQPTPGSRAVHRSPSRRPPAAAVRWGDHDRPCQLRPRIGTCRPEGGAKPRTSGTAASRRLARTDGLPSAG